MPEAARPDQETGLFKVMYSMRAMRRLKPDPVPEVTLLRLIDAAMQAPSPSNTQPWRWIIVRDAEQKRRLAELNRKESAAYLRPQRPATATPDDSAREQRTRAAFDWQAEHMHEAPALVVACAAVDPAADMDARRYSARGVWQAVQNLLLAARGLGMGATPTTLALRDREASRAILGLPDSIEAHVLIPVGYPMGRFGPVRRPPVSEVTRFERWS
jgi:nitroreductase